MIVRSGSTERTGDRLVRCTSERGNLFYFVKPHRVAHLFHTKLVSHVKQKYIGQYDMMEYSNMVEDLSVAHPLRISKLSDPSLISCQKVFHPQAVEIPFYQVFVNVL